MTFKKALSLIAFYSLISIPFAMAGHRSPNGKMEDLDPSLTQAATSQQTDFLQINGPDNQDPFDWQNRKHFKDLVQKFQGVAEKELEAGINEVIARIKKANHFFEDRYDILLSSIRDTIFFWMNDDVLTWSAFLAETANSESGYWSYHSEEEEEEDAWRVGFMRGFERESDSEASDCEEYYGADSDFGLELEESEDEFELWKRRKLIDMFLIDVGSADDFSTNDIDLYAIRRFLEEHVEGGYSWLVNEKIEGSFETSNDFVRQFFQDDCLTNEILDGLFGGLWFYYDWEGLDISNPLFIANTYIATLKSLQQQAYGHDTRTHILQSIEALFIFNEKDFKDPFKLIRKHYNQAVKRKNWLDATVQWSLYTAYRKVFAAPAKRSKVHKFGKEIPSLPSLQSFNRETYLTRRLDNASNRAEKYYTKVYPHPSTTHVRFQNTLFDIATPLGVLRGVGQQYEALRKRQSENLFVPEIYLILQQNPSDGRPIRFIKLPLQMQEFLGRPMTCDSDDGIFINGSDETYFAQAKKDVVTGNVLQGNEETIESQKFDAIHSNIGLCNPSLIHSERVLAQLFRNPDFIRASCQKLADYLKTEFAAGLYEVQSALLLGYSTNTVCPFCTPTLISLMNSHEEGEFLNLLSKELNSLDGPIQFETPGYTPNTGESDWTKFRLNIFVSARINFDSQAHDMAAEGQHCHAGVSKAPATHNSHARLFFPDNCIDLSQPPEIDEEQVDPHQRFFYEFVGKTIHEINETKNPYIQAGKLTFPGVVFSSGSSKWQ